MIPQSPVVPGKNIPEIVYAKDQPEYIPLPTIHRHNGEVLSRWKLTWRERLRVLWTGNFYLTVSTFNMPLQPLRPSTLHWWNEVAPIQFSFEIWQWLVLRPTIQRELSAGKRCALIWLRFRLAWRDAR